MELLRKLPARASALARRERLLHDAMDLHVAKVLEGKNFLLSKEVLHDSGFRGADDLEGFDVIGDLAPTGQFEPQPRRRALSKETLCAGLDKCVVAFSAAWVRQATPSSTTRLRRQPRRSSRQGGYLADIDEDVRRAFIIVIVSDSDEADLRFFDRSRTEFKFASDERIILIHLF